MASNKDIFEKLAKASSNLENWKVPSLVDDYSRMASIPIARSAVVELADHSLSAASSAVRSIARQIQTIEAQLDQSSAIAFWVAGGPSNQAFFPREVFAEDPDRIVFSGVDELGDPFVLIQHVSQLNISVRVAQLANEEQRQPIGFHMPS